MADPPSITGRLLADVAAGVPGSVDALLLRHRGRLKRLIQARWDQRLSRRIDPSDVIQETWIAATAKLDDYIRYRPIRFYPWLRAIAVQRLIDLHRKHLRGSGKSVLREVAFNHTVSSMGLHLLGQAIADQGIAPEEQVSAKEQAELLQAALEQLSDRDREVIVLRHMEGLSVADVADVLGIAEGTVKSRHFRSLTRLHALLRATQ